MMMFILVVVTGLLAITNAWLLWCHFKQTKNMSLLEKRFSKQSQILNASIVSIGSRVLSSEQRLHSAVHEKKEHPIENHNSAYDKAKSLLAQGLSEDMVSVNSGLSLSEVELIKLIHFNSQRAVKGEVA